MLGIAVFDDEKIIVDYVGELIKENLDVNAKIYKYTKLEEFKGDCKKGILQKINNEEISIIEHIYIINYKQHIQHLNKTILHFCSVSLIDAPIKEAHKKAIEFAKKHNCLISFDPNVRLPLWESPEACRKAILEFLPLANIVKISDEELEFITGISDEAKALEFLLQGDVEVIIYTKGTNGAEFITKERKVFSPSFRVQAQDTTGAGDSFIGSFLYQVAEDDNTLESLVNLSEEKIKEILTFSNATAALTVCKRGAIGALPTKEEVLALAQGR